MKVEIEIQTPTGKHVFQSDDHTALIKSQLAMLERYRDDGRIPSEHLLRDIATYKFMLDQKNSDKLIREYMTYKNKARDRGEHLKNYQVADALGWKYWAEGGSG